MAEAVGIAAGIITLMTTSRKVADGISKILDLNHAPNILLALNNEVVDLHFVISSPLNYSYALPRGTLHGVIFPQWFWSRAVSATFSAESDGGRFGPELILRFPCIRPLDGDWGKVVQGGDINSLMNLINRKHASLHDVDSKFGATALHWATHCHRMRMTSTLLRAGADLAAEDGFGLTPRHCLLFDNASYIPAHFRSHQDDRILLLERLQTIDASFEDDLLEEPILRKVYQGSDTYEALRHSIVSGGRINQGNSLGETVLIKAISHNDERAVRMLLEHGASATQCDRFMQSLGTLEFRSSTVSVQLDGSQQMLRLTSIVAHGA
ncbi:MAG: hypothetical protein Q9182_001126 [Xanthomendoza sp. 2 TL-2023]